MMRIRFQTRDGVVGIKECPAIDLPLGFVFAPLEQGPVRDHFLEYRRYSFRGEVLDQIPTVVEDAL